jgi:hypothetical protein
LIAITLGGGVPASVGAQNACAARDANGVVRGQVLDELTRLPIEHALVTIPGLPGCEVQTDAHGRFAFSRVAVGPARLHAAFIGFHAREQPITVATGVPIDVTIRVQGFHEPAIATLDALPSAEQMNALQAVLAYYRQPSREGEVEAVREAERVTGSRPTPGLAHPAFLLYVDPVTVSAADSAGLRAAGTQVCRPPELAACPGEGATTFLRLWGPGRSSVDTAFYRVDESVADPAACRRGNSFVGSSRSVAILAHGSDGWKVVESRSTFSASGRCGPRRRAAR